MIDILQTVSFTIKIISLAVKYPLSVTSWGRTPRRNAQVGGHPASKHLRWLAIDIVLDHEDDKIPCFQDIKRLGLVFLDEGDHIHVQVPKDYAGGL